MVRYLAAVFFVLVSTTAWGAREEFGVVLDLAGTVRIACPGRREVLLDRTRDVMRVLRNGDEVRVGPDGSLTVAALYGNKLYLLPPGSAARVHDRTLTAVRGKVVVKAGFPIPPRIRGRNWGGMAMSATLRGEGDDCLAALRPFDEVVGEPFRRITWRDVCEEELPVVVTLTDAAGAVLFRQETVGEGVELPAGTVAPGGRYTLTLTYGKRGRLSTAVGVLSAAERAELARNYARYRETADLSRKIEFVFYLIGHRLYGPAREELLKLREEFPDNAQIEGIANLL